MQSQWPKITTKYNSPVCDNALWFGPFKFNPYPSGLLDRHRRNLETYVTNLPLQNEVHHGHASYHWELRFVIMPTLSLSGPRWVVIMTAAHCRQWRQRWHHDNTRFSLTEYTACVVSRIILGERPHPVTGPILGLHPANERRRYFVTTSLIGWSQTSNQLCSSCLKRGGSSATLRPRSFPAWYSSNIHTQIALVALHVFVITKHQLYPDRHVLCRRCIAVKNTRSSNHMIFTENGKIPKLHNFWISRFVSAQQYPVRREPMKLMPNWRQRYL